MLIPNRHGNTPAYRYGFQGQEKDDEIKGEGNSLNYTFRMHDPRVGRFFARDPLEKYYAEQTPYQFSSNAPIHARELEGCETAHDMRFERRERQLLAGEITPKQFREQNNAEGVGALLGLAIVATAYSGGRAAPVLETLFYRVAFEGVKRQMYIIAAGNFAIGFFDEGGQIDTPGSLDDMGRSTRLIFGKMANSKFAQKFIFTMGKLDFALGEGTTVGKNMARITDNEITNMAKSILRGEKFKENGIDTQQKLLGLVDEAFDKGVEIFSKIPNTVNGKVIGTVDVKQLTLKDGTRVNFNFLTETGTVTPRLATVSIPDANVNIGAKVKELKIIRATAKAAEIKESK
jgi:RHS repeat-associated protein